VHMNFAGNYLLAKTLLGPVGREVAVKLAPAQTAAPEALTQEQCRVRLAYTDTDRYILAKTIYDGFLLKPPFTGQVYHAEEVQQRKQELEDLKKFTSKQELARCASLYEQAIALNPSDWNLYWKLGTILADRAGEQARAEAPFRKVQELAPTFYLGYTALGQVYLRLERPAEAAEQFKKSIRLYDAHPMTYFMLGSAYDRLKDWALAAKGYKQAIYWQPDDGLCYNLLGKALKEQGRIEEGVQVLRKGTEYCPENALIHANLGLLLAETGHGAQAKAEVRKALELDPNSEQVQRAARRLMGRMGP
jgi:Flp pilus assembly protein TadD